MPWSDGVVAGAKFIGGTGLGSGRNRWMGAWPRRVAQFQARGTVEVVNRTGTAAPCAVRRGAALPRQDRWRGRPCHVNGRDSGRRHVSQLPRHHAWRGTGI